MVEVVEAVRRQRRHDDDVGAAQRAHAGIERQFGAAAAQVQNLKQLGLPVRADLPVDLSIEAGPRSP